MARQVGSLCDFEMRVKENIPRDLTCVIDANVAGSNLPDAACHTLATYSTAFRLDHVLRPCHSELDLPRPSSGGTVANVSPIS